MKYIVQILFSFFRLENTPVLMSSNPISQNGKAYAIAAMMPFAMVPVDDTPLLSYALAHKTVNSSYTMTASNNDDVSMALMNGDPFTSAEQKQRDLYEINDTDWYRVSFEGVYSSSVCHLAMHNDWIQSKGYVTDGIVNMNLPEQGISGPFKITSIKHITPQKKPIDEDPNDDYEYQPVTGLFIHHSDQVHNITFVSANGDWHETIGVTAPHPIFSTTHNDWRLAGELEVGEKVLTYHGEASVTNTEKKDESEAVYNLEIKDLHNFLVGDSGFVVHNNCILDDLIASLKNIGKKYNWVDGDKSTHFKCAEKAKELRKHLKSKGVTNPCSKKLRVFNKINGKWSNFIEFNGKIIAETGFHIFTLVNGKVYDNLNPNGIDINDFFDKLDLPPNQFDTDLTDLCD
ncbi:MAG TPA: Hint domain-containing protein [Saprospiraceae bacterium]|nr:Hint domain-containing protein [Saprospiraceae bacterium]